MTDGIETKRILCHNGMGGCFMCCGLIAHVDKKTNRIVKIEPNKDHPINMGRICDDRNVIGLDFPMRYLYHHSQLLRPLKRVGERGEGKWKEISYDQALDEIAEKLKELKETYGPESLVSVEGTYRSDVRWARMRFLAGYGNPGNFCSPGTVCHKYYFFLDHMAVGGWTADFPNPSSLKCAVIHGTDFGQSFPTVQWYYKANLKNIRSIVIDPRCTELARDADLWLQIRPGTDAALFLAWVKLIIDEKMYDKKFLEDWSNAPFLVRTDTMKILREADLVAKGSSDKHVVIDSATKQPKIYDSETRQYESPDVKPSLDGLTTLDLVDKKSIACKTVWNLLADRVSVYTPEYVEPITWISSYKIRESARWFGTLKPSGIYRGVSTDQIGINASRVHQLRTLLSVITGNINVLGGLEVMPPGPVINGQMFVRDSMLEMQEKFTPQMKEKQIGSGRYRVHTWPGADFSNRYYRRRWGIDTNTSGHSMLVPMPLVWRAILECEPYPVKSLITWTASPITWAPNTKLVYKALKSPNLALHVVVEHVMTPTAELADYVLPCASKSLESPYCSNWEDHNPCFVIGDQAAEPLGERRSDYEFWRGLSVRMGFGDYLPWNNLREAIEDRLKPLNLSFDECARKALVVSDPPLAVNFHEETDPKINKPYGFATATGKAEVWIVGLEMLGYDPLPFYQEPAESPVSTPMVAKEYPLVLTTGGRFRPMFHSEYRQWGIGTREQHPWPIVDIHTETARPLGVSTGDWVWIETRRGRIMQKARVSHGIHPKVVNVQSHWWYPEMPGEEPWLHGAFISNANVLTLDDPDTLDPLTGNWCNRALLCKVYKARPEEMQSLMQQ